MAAIVSFHVVCLFYALILCWQTKHIPTEFADSNYVSLSVIMIFQVSLTARVIPMAKVIPLIVYWLQRISHSLALSLFRSQYWPFRLRPWSKMRPMSFTLFVRVHSSFKALRSFAWSLDRKCTRPIKETTHYRYHPQQADPVVFLRTVVAIVVMAAQINYLCLEAATTDTPMLLGSKLLPQN